MSNVRTVLGSRRVVRFAFAGVTAASLAGCADSDRFASNPLANPYATASAERRLPSDAGRDVPYRSPSSTGSISSRPLPPPPPIESSSLPQRHLGSNYASYAVPAHQSPRLAEAPVPARSERTTGSIATGHGGWSAEGGLPVLAAQGETARIIGERYNVPPDALLRANGMSSTAEIRPGTRVIIPVYSATGTPAPAHAERLVADQHRPDHGQPDSERPKHDHSSREKLLARHDVPAHFVRGPQPASPAKIAEAEQHEHGRARALERVAHAPGRSAPAAVAAQAEPAKKLAALKPIKVEQPKPAKVAKLEPVKVAKLEPEVKKPAPVVDPTPTASLPPAAAAAPSGSANPEFRWPARGRIIQGFKSGGNDGINIAVPEGTAVKAAESGVVAYAGSEVKGFGNLVLIRHPNGYVSSYANNGELDVKRGEQVKRGQTIAKSGQSGNVASPQLHFELRKGSTPVDPTQYLAGL